MNGKFDLKQSIFSLVNDKNIYNNDFYNYTINLDIIRNEIFEIKDLNISEINGNLEKFKKINNDFIKIGLLSNNKSIKTNFLQKLILEMKSYNNQINLKRKFIKEKKIKMPTNIEEYNKIKDKINEINKYIEIISKNEKNHFIELFELLCKEKFYLTEQCNDYEYEEIKKNKELSKNKNNNSNNLNKDYINTPIGLNFKFFNDDKLKKHYLFLDCKSFGYLFSLFSSLNYDNLNSIKFLNYKINQKLILNYITKNFNIIIYFTGINNKIDDKFINKLIKKLSENQILIIIHNLYLFSKQSFENYIKINFENKFIKKIIDKENNIYFYIQKINNFHIIHIPFGNESIKNFEKNNLFVYSYLARIIINSFFLTDKKNFLFDEIKICCDDYLNKLKNNIKYNNFIEENKIFIPKSFYSIDEKCLNIILEVSNIQELKINVILKKNYYLISISGLKNNLKNIENNKNIRMLLNKTQNGNFLKQIKIFYSKILLNNNKFLFDKENNLGIVKIKNFIYK